MDMAALRIQQEPETTEGVIQLFDEHFPSELEFLSFAVDEIKVLGKIDGK